MRKRELTFKSTGITAALALSLGLIGAGTINSAAPAFATGSTGRSDGCPAPGEIPGLGHSPTFTDGGVALFAGGDYTAEGGSAEAEGLLVVGGNATFAKSGGVFNVGRVGMGSGIIPAAGGPMLAVGGDLSVGRGVTLDVGHGLTSGPRYGGSVRVGGKLDVQGRLETNGGESPDGLGRDAALKPHAGFGDTIRKESAALGALKATGTTEAKGGSVTFRGAGPAKGGLQVFEISAADIDSVSTFTFASIPAGSSVVVNVTGSRAVNISPMAVGFNNDRVDVYSSSKFGEAASRILYNFEDSASLTLGGGGNFMGSVLAPEASADITASTNGRLYVGGDLTTRGAGNESHNYPWNGTPPFSCEPGEPGGPGTPDVPSTPSPTPPGTPDEPGGPDEPETPGATPEQPGAPSRPAEKTPSATPSEPSATPSDSAPSPGKDGSLATTGAGPTVMISVAAALVLAAGAAIAFLARRRRRA
ncbi:choice-of-anchor A family protein [Streptomyces sp. SCSIO-PteL053]|uniref:choice-of-anchor A family protein n=1 Tax=Streptomyces parvus TaxID=66428 RepID=UPI0037191038|nr:choice-of-anchor A family protein [Streptomyces sp. SCSIO-PteL053]